MCRIIDRLVGSAGDPGIVQPQPTASLLSVAPKIAIFCVCEVITADNTAK